MANVNNVNDFVEQLSNCIGEISGDEVVFKKIPHSSKYVVRMRNHNEKVANIWYDYEMDNIIVQLIPEFRNKVYSLDDLTIDTIKGISQMIRKNALIIIGESMKFEEAKNILNENGYYLLEASNFIEDFNAWINDREGEQYEEKEIIDYGWELIAQDVGYPNGHKTYYDYYKIDVDGITYKLEVAWNSFNETIVGNKIWKENENV